MDWVTNYKFNPMVLYNKINNVFNKLGNIKINGNNNTISNSISI